MNMNHDDDDSTNGVEGNGPPARIMGNPGDEAYNMSEVSMNMSFLMEEAYGSQDAPYRTSRGQSTTEDAVPEDYDEDEETSSEEEEEEDDDGYLNEPPT